MNLDPITLEVLRNRFDAIADTMESTLVKCAYSSMVKEAADASVALLDATGDTIAQGLALPIHLGSIPPAAKCILEKFPAKTLRDGDVLLMNDPYSGGQHYPDFIVLVPIFYHGDVVAMAVSLAHHQDVGGRSPGSQPTDATDVFEEGICIPPIKVMEAGVWVEPVLEMIRHNVRNPHLTIGDLNAQIACGRVGATELAGLLDRYGRDVIFAAMRELLDRAETQTRALIDRIPDGTYRFCDWLDNDGVDLDKRICISAAMTVKGSGIHVDFTGTSPQVRGPANAVPSGALSAVRFVIRALTNAEIPNNEGCYRMISLTLPEGIVLNPRYPGAVNLRAPTLRRVVDTVIGAFAQAMPGQVPACNNGHPLVAMFGGLDDRNGKAFIMAEMGTGGMGARPHKDGVDCIVTDTSNSANIPIEVMEPNAPLRILYYRIRADSGGAGLFRGGCGYEKGFECLADRVTVSHRGERHYTQPWGLDGGRPGASAKSIVVRAGGRRERVPSKQTFDLRRGDRLLVWTSGGGGYGNPLERPADHVLADVLDRKVGVRAARTEYGVVIRGERVREDETRALRARLRAVTRAA